MAEPWFEPEAARYFVLVALTGLSGLTAPLIIQGRRRGLVIALWRMLAGVGLAFTATGICALVQRQPDYTSLPFLLSGIALAIGYAGSLRLLQRHYHRVEYRKVAARDL